MTRITSLWRQVNGTQAGGPSTYNISSNLCQQLVNNFLPCTLQRKYLCEQKRDPDEKKRKPRRSERLGAFLKDSKLEERVEAAQVVPNGSRRGMQIASVDEAIFGDAGRTLFVR